MAAVQVVLHAMTARQAGMSDCFEVTRCNRRRSVAGWVLLHPAQSNDHDVAQKNAPIVNVNCTATSSSSPSFICSEITYNMSISKQVSGTKRHEVH